MKKANVFDRISQRREDLQVLFVYESPSLKIFNFRFDPGQSLLMYSDEMLGEMSFVVIEGRGEFVGEEARRYSIQTGDVVVSELSEPHSFLATTDLHLLVTISAYGSSCETAIPETRLSQRRTEELAGLSSTLGSHTIGRPFQGRADSTFLAEE